MMTFKNYFKEQTKTSFEQTVEELEQTGFATKFGKVAGDDAVLIFPPNMGIGWTKDNMIYRSSMWTYPEGKLISAGFKKFFNWGEQPELTEPPQSLKDAVLFGKMDGSLLICSKHKGELIRRTRGTFDATQLGTGKELYFLEKKYPKAFDNKYINSEEYTVLYEWLSPDNVIVLKYGDEPDLVLIGCIKHSDYSLLPQSKINEISEEIDVPRPEQFNFGGVKSMLSTVKDLKGKEGVCVYFNKNQEILKVKSADYLVKHAFKSNVTVKNMVEMYFEWGKPSKEEFLKRIENEFDYECMTMAEEVVERVIDINKSIHDYLQDIKQRVAPLKGMSQKEAAMHIQSNFQPKDMKYAFNFFNNKPILDITYKKLMIEFFKSE